jgi:hypothetical protein
MTTFSNPLLRAVPALLCLLLSFRTAAQPGNASTLKDHHDEIVIHLGGENRLVVPVQSMKNLEGLAGINALVQRLNADLATVADSLLANKYAKTVLYRQTGGGGRTLKVNTKAEERTELYVEKETGLIKTLRRPDSVAVTMSNQQPLFFILDSVQVMGRLAQTDLDELIRRMGADVRAELERRRKGDIIPYNGPQVAVYENEQDGRRKLLLRRKQMELDQIALFGNTGVGLVRDKLVPEIGLGVALQLNRGQRGTRYLGLNGSMHYFFERRDDGGYQMFINTFVTLELAQSFSREGKLWQKVGIGYLVGEQGGYFGPNTFKLTLDLTGKPRLGTLHLIPELILTDNFKTIFPGIRLGVGF